MELSETTKQSSCIMICVCTCLNSYDRPIIFIFIFSFSYIYMQFTVMPFASFFHPRDRSIHVLNEACLKLGLF